MSREKSLIKNTLIMAVGTFLPRIINLLTTPIITSSTTGAQYGQIDLVTSTILNFIVPLCTLQLEQALFRFLVDAKSEEEQRKTITNGYLIIFIMMILAAIICLFVPINMFEGPLKLFIIGYIWIEIIATTSRFVLRAFSKYKEYSFLAALVVFVNFIVVSICLLWLKTGYIGVLIALVAADVVGFLYVLCVCNVFKYIRFKYIDFGFASKMLSYALPFIPNQVSWYINQLSDRWIINIFLGASANGIYALANKIPSIVTILYPAFNLAWTDSATRSVNDPDSAQYYNRMFKMLFCIVSAGSILLLAVSPFLFIILNRNESLESAYLYTPTLILAMYFYCFSQFFGSIYVAVKSAKNMAVTTTISAAINIIINVVFINIIGVQAAVISTLIANLFLAGYRFIDLNRRFCRLRINKRLTTLTIIVFVISMLLALSIDLKLWIINIVFAVIFAYFISGDVFIRMIRSFIKKR